MYMLCKRSWYK